MKKHLILLSLIIFLFAGLPAFAIESTGTGADSMPIVSDGSANVHLIYRATRMEMFFIALGALGGLPATVLWSMIGPHLFIVLSLLFFALYIIAEKKWFSDRTSHMVHKCVAGGAVLLSLVLLSNMYALQRLATGRYVLEVFVVLVPVVTMIVEFASPQKKRIHTLLVVATLIMLPFLLYMIAVIPRG